MVQEVKCRKPGLTNLCELDQELQQIWYALASNRRGGHYVDVFSYVRVLPVQSNIQPLLIELKHGSLHPVPELCRCVFALLIKGLLHRGIFSALPGIQPVHLQVQYAAP